MSVPAVTLSNGLDMPILGLGVWKASEKECFEAVRTALELGYRHIDTASVYGNESDVGNAIRESHVARDEVFITTKLWNKDQGYDCALRAFDESLKRLGFEYIDLYLVHWPQSETRADSWRALEKIYRDGRAKAIGVSNYTQAHLEELVDKCEVVPFVNQVEFHPFLYQRELLDYCRTLGIQLEAYSPLAQGQRFDHPVLLELARKHKRSPAQIMIRWCIALDVVVIPKSVHAERIRENMDVFDFSLDANDMQALASLNQNLRTCWDPTCVP